MSRERRLTLLFFVWLVMLTFAGIFFVTRTPAAGVKGAQLIYSDSLGDTTAYVGGDFYGVTNRYVSVRLGWKTTTTSPVTITLWLESPVGTQVGTQTINAALGNVADVWTTEEITMSAPYYANLRGTILNEEGTVTPTIDIYLHGQ